MQQVENLSLIPKMVAARDDVHSRRKNLLGGFGGDARAAGGILTIGDDQADAVLTAEPRRQFADSPASRLPHDVSNEKKFHPATVMATDE
jgi:hypothetical protein